MHRPNYIQNSTYLQFELVTVSSSFLAVSIAEARRLQAHHVRSQRQDRHRVAAPVRSASHIAMRACSCRGDFD